MSGKAQSSSGVGVLVVIIIIAVVAFYLYESGYLGHIGQPAAAVYNSTVPITLIGSSSTNLSNIYPQENIQVISEVHNHSNKPINVSISPYNCPFIPTSIKYLNVYPGSSASLIWNFSSSSATSCSIVFLACFNTVSFTNYPITFKTPEFSGTAPQGLESSSPLEPVSLAVNGLSDTIVSPPTPTNSTYYISAYQTGVTGSLSGLSWLDISENGVEIYYTNSAGQISQITNSVNLSSSRYQLLFNSAQLLSPFPIQIETQPVTSSAGYTTGADINVSAGYKYCLESTPIPVTVH